MSKNINLTMNKEQFDILLEWAAHFMYTDDDTGRMLYNLLQEKSDKMTARELYTQYKTADSEDKRDEARRAYLREKGVPESNIGPYFHGISQGDEDGPGYIF